MQTHTYQIVVLNVVGSSPTLHPSGILKKSSAFLLLEVEVIHNWIKPNDIS